MLCTRVLQSNNLTYAEQRGVGSGLQLEILFSGKCLFSFALATSNLFPMSLSLLFIFPLSHTSPSSTHPHTHTHRCKLSIQNAQIREQSHAPFSSITHTLVFPDFDPNISSCHHLSSPAHHLFSVSTVSFHFLSFHSSSLLFILFLLMSAACLSFPCLFPLCDRCEMALLFWFFFFSRMISRIRTDPFHSTETREDTSE